MGFFALGLITGIPLEKSVSYSLCKRGCEGSGRLFWLPVANGLIYMGMYVRAGGQRQSLLSALSFCLCTSLLLAVGIIDWKTREIPWGYNLLIGVLGAARTLCHLEQWQEHAAGFFAVSGLLYLFFLLSEGKGIGGGDVKLMAAAGLFLGWEKALWAFLWGGTGALLFFLFKKGKQKRQERHKRKTLALGPFLAVGIFVAML